MTHTDPAVTIPARFSEQIRAATWGDHGDAEHVSYMDELMAGRLDRDQYAQLVVQLWFVYRELEAPFARMRVDPLAGPFMDPALLRLSALEADLEVLVGGSWRDEVAPLPTTEAYVARLREVGADWPAGHVAHHYTRYLGDLSGGQFIGKCVRTHYGLTAEAGAAFYRFDGIREPGAWKERYRQQLDELVLDQDEAERMIAEVRRAYHHNTAMLAELGEHVLGDR